MSENEFNPDYGDDPKVLKAALKDAGVSIGKLQAELDNHRWIPVEEPPKESGFYQVCIEESPYPQVREYDAATAYWYVVGDMVTHYRLIDLPEGV